MHSNGRSNVIGRWLTLLRVPNLAMIVLTQYLLGYGIIRPLMLLQGVEPPLQHFNFLVLVLVTVLIAAGGYIINDHFDVNTDRKNKPGKNMLEGKISVRKALRVYYIINGIAILAGFYLSLLAGSFQLGLIFPAIAGLLWFYSSRYQRMPFWGNLIIALLTAMVLLIVWLFEYYLLLRDTGSFVKVLSQIDIINTFVWAYASFAFLLTLIREMLKDIEDMHGDQSSAYLTIPVIWGVKAARGIVSAMILITAGLLALGQYYLYQKGLILPFWYLLVAVQGILIYLLILVIVTKDSRAYGFAGNTAKVIMLAGILSMELIYISLG